MHQSTVVGLAWPLALLIVGIFTTVKLSPIATQFVEMLKSSRDAEIEEARVALLERENAAQLVSGTLDQRITAEQARLGLEAAQRLAEQQAIKDDPKATHEFVRAKRQIDLDAHKATAVDRARANLPANSGQLNAHAYKEYVRFHSNPVSYEVWLPRQ